jgi:HK97 family phage major capsid protein
MTTLPSISELREQFEAAEQRMAETNAAIISLEPGADEQLIADLEGKFTEQEAETKHLAAAIYRYERMEEARKAVPGLAVAKDASSAARVTSEPLTYRERGPHSFFADMYRSNRGDHGAQSRLRRHMDEMKIERRDLDTTSGDGLEFVPPAHLQDQWAELARAGRVFANYVPSLGAPPAKNFTLPKVSTGSATAIQTADNAAITETDLEPVEVSFSTATIAGMQDLSIQLLDFSNPAMDQVIAQDLASDYAQKLDAQLIFGTGSSGQVEGILDNADVNSVTFTAATPTVALLYPKLADAVNQVHTNRFQSPDAWFMHPRRWAWILAALDTTNRPLVAPIAPQNPVGGFTGLNAEGIVGSLLGLPVYTDANIPTTTGAGTNQDTIFLTRRADNTFFETGTPAVRVFDSPGSGTLTVRIRVHGYIAYSVGRFPKGHAKITGTGLVAPSF